MATLIDDSDGRMSHNTRFKVISAGSASEIDKDLAQKCSEVLLGREYASIADLTRDVNGIPGNEVRIIGSSTYGYSLGVISPHPLDSDKDLYRSLGFQLEIQY